MTPWEIKAKEFVNCNCAYGCPCQFNALPTHGNCEAAVAIEIEQGHYGDVKLDGLRIGGIYQWPGPIHEGRGKARLCSRRGGLLAQQARPAARLSDGSPVT